MKDIVEGLETLAAWAANQDNPPRAGAAVCTMLLLSYRIRDESGELGKKRAKAAIDKFRHGRGGMTVEDLDELNDQLRQIAGEQ